MGGAVAEYHGRERIGEEQTGPAATVNGGQTYGSVRHFYYIGDIMVKSKYKYEIQISDNIHRKKQDKARFLKWIKSNPKFKRRKPTVAETVYEMTKGCLKGLVELDQQKAAQKYWRAEAQYWLRHITVVKINIQLTTETYDPIPAYIPIKRGQYGSIDENNYIPSTRIMGNHRAKMQVVDRAMADLECWIQRYERYAEFFEVFDPLVKVYQKIKQEIEKKR